MPNAVFDSQLVRILVTLVDEIVDLSFENIDSEIRLDLSRHDELPKFCNCLL
jgi:hypothetical protein